MTAAIELPARVRLDGHRLLDEDRDLDIALNPTGAWLLGHLVAGRDRAQVVEELAGHTGTDPDTVARDLDALLVGLNRAYLVNLPRAAPGSRRLPSVADLVVMVITRRLPTGGRRPRRRWEIDTGSLAATASSVAGQLTGVAARLVGLVLAGAAIPVVGGGGTRGAGLLAVMALAAGASVMVHEVAHALAAVALGTRPFLVTGRLAAAVVHRPHRRQALVAVAGPLLPALVGLALWLWLPVTVAPMLAGAAAIPFLAHAVGLSVLGHDGRNLVTRPAPS